MCVCVCTQTHTQVVHIRSLFKKLHYLDDGNIIHPNLYKLLKIVDNSKIYAFNPYNSLLGNHISWIY
jgi:hypothetical protein